MNASPIPVDVLTLEQLLDGHRRIDLASLRHELKTLHEIRAWAIGQAGMDFGEGDTVEIVGKLDTDNGWSPYREALAPGATGTVDKICFSPNREWCALIVLDRAWQVSEIQGATKRHWKGKASETPEGFEQPSASDQVKYPNGKRKAFSIGAEHLRRLQVGSGG